MFPGGVDPDARRRMQDQFDAANKHYETIGEIMQRTDIRRHMANIGQIVEERERALRGVPLAEISQRLAAVGHRLNSPDLRGSLEAVSRANEFAQARFGPEGLDAAGRIFGSRVAPDPIFAAGFERAEKKIREGRADEVLDEAMTLVSGKETRLTLEQAEKDTLVDAARQQAKPEDDAPAPMEIRAGVDVETVIELAELSEEDLDALEYYLGQITRVLLFAVTVAVVVMSPQLGWEQAAGALGSAMALWGFVNAARARKKEQNTGA